MHEKKFRVLFDTNIYGTIAEENLYPLADKIEKTENIIVYGFTIIRKELRNTPKKLMVSGENFRNLILEQYDYLVGNHELQVNKVIEGLAQEYMLNYEGGIPKYKLKNDFLIVACASLHQLDIIASDDKHSMSSLKALETYRKVNFENNLRTPNFYSLMEIEKLL
ncbi:MAG: hypothetical protein Q7S21_02725 [archaeon]|nr:hypothetical protein [archaeon]